jgi:hypothetical protein
MTWENGSRPFSIARARVRIVARERVSSPRRGAQHTPIQPGANMREVFLVGGRVHAVVMPRSGNSYFSVAKSPTMSIQKIFGSPFLTVKLTRILCFPKSMM